MWPSSSPFHIWLTERAGACFLVEFAIGHFTVPTWTLVCCDPGSMQSWGTGSQMLKLSSGFPWNWGSSFTGTGCPSGYVAGLMTMKAVSGRRGSRLAHIHCRGTIVLGGQYRVTSSTVPSVAAALLAMAALIPAYPTSAHVGASLQYVARPKLQYVAHHRSSLVKLHPSFLAPSADGDLSSLA